MVAPHDLCLNFLFSCQMICKQHIILNHVFLGYESNLEPITLIYQIFCVLNPWLLQDLHDSLFPSISKHSEKFTMLSD